MEDEAIRAVVLLSGGLDSATTLAVARHQGRDVWPLAFAYGQRHATEIEASARVAASMGARPPVVFSLDLRAFGGSALTAEIAVPKDALDSGGIPVTYVPARNTIFLAVALGYAETIGASEIWLGVNAVDFSGYPDCRPEFIGAFQRVIETGTRSGTEAGLPRLMAPLIELTKADIIRLGTKLGVDYSLTHSCYDPDALGAACGHCDSCILRRRGFEEAGVEDPTRYGAGVE